MFRQLRSCNTEQVQPYEEGFQGAPNTYNQPQGTLNPNTPGGLAMAQQNGSVDGVKQYYDQVNRLANDNTKKNGERSDAIQKAYGVTLQANAPPQMVGPTQVYAVVNGGYVNSFASAPGICAKYGGRVATTAQLEEAQKKGADWCFSAWTAEGVGRWPITTTPVWGCGSRQGIIEWTPDTGAGVNCYGPKPMITDPAAGNILPFNGQMWDQPSEPTYLTVPSGYLETTGPQPACFNGLSAEQAQANCDALGKRCVGFSYSKNGTGSGCYKGNHDAGLNGNPAYMGYVKTPIPTPPTNTPWQCLSNIPVPLRRNTNGDIECMSPNYRDCMWQANDANCRNLLNSNPQGLAPLECGAMHARVWGGPGYDNSGHWCYMSDRTIPKQ